MDTAFEFFGGEDADGGMPYSRPSVYTPPRAVMERCKTPDHHASVRRRSGFLKRQLENHLNEIVFFDHEDLGPLPYQGTGQRADWSNYSNTVRVPNMPALP